MPGMLLVAEMLHMEQASQAIADREYRRGLERGLRVAGTVIIWLGATTGQTRPAFTHEEISKMVVALLNKEAQLEGIIL